MQDLGVIPISGRFVTLPVTLRSLRVHRVLGLVRKPLSLPQAVCREKLHGSWVTVKDPKAGLQVERIAERLLTADDIKAAPILSGREGEDVCAPFLESKPRWSRLAIWR
jgi:hypothetical protein